MAENFTSMIEITRFENDMVVIDGNRCPFAEMKQFIIII